MVLVMGILIITSHHSLRIPYIKYMKLRQDQKKKKNVEMQL